MNRLLRTLRRLRNPAVLRRDLQLLGATLRLRLFSRSDVRRWSDERELNPQWDERARIIARHIPPGSRVLDLGSGRRSLERFLDSTCTYIPADLVSRGPDTVILDLNERPLPDLAGLGADIVVLAGVLEYVRDVPSLIDWVTRQAPACLLSYQLASSTTWRESARRAVAGWVNSYRREDLHELFAGHGFQCELETVGDTSEGGEPILLFRLAFPRGDRALIKRVQSKNLTYLTEQKLESIVWTIRDLERKHLPGLMIEAGCALGGSTILIASVKSRSRPLYVYDVFGMIPPPSQEDGNDTWTRYAAIEEGKSEGIGGDRYYGYRDDLYETVRRNLREFGIDEAGDRVTLVRGLLQETMQIGQPVCFAHVDVDWYEPVKTSLARILPWLIDGGSVIVDDYHAWSGARKATDEALARSPGSFRLDDSAGSLKITRIAGGPPYELA